MNAHICLRRHSIAHAPSVAYPGFQQRGCSRPDTKSVCVGGEGTGVLPASGPIQKVGVLCLAHSKYVIVNN